MPPGNQATINSAINFDYVLTISAKQLDGIAAALWEEKGYTVVYLTPDSGDDVVALSGDKGVLIQCKMAGFLIVFVTQNSPILNEANLSIPVCIKI